MDPGFAMLFVAIIGGVFSILAVKIQKNQSKLMEKIDKQSVFIDKEKEIRQELVQAEKERDSYVEQMTILSMNINIQLVRSVQDIDPRILQDLNETSKELAAAYKESTEKIRNISIKYESLISMSNVLQSEIDEYRRQRRTI